MTIDEKIIDEKLPHDINREAAKISPLSSNKIHKYEYLTGEEILLLSNQQIIEQARLTYSPLGKAFEKQIETIQDQEKKQVYALNTLKSDNKKLTIEDKSNNQSKVTTIFNELINKRKEIVGELYDGVDYNNLKFEYVGSTKDVSFYEYRDSKERFNVIKNSQIKFSEARNKQKEFLIKINEVKIGKKTTEQKEVIKNLSYNSREEVINLFRDFTEMLSDANYSAKQNETKGTRLKILTPKQMLQRLSIALAQVKAGNDSETLLNEIRQNIYSLHQAKEITKKVYNNLMKSL